MAIKPEALQKLFPANKNIVELANALNLILPKYEINTKDRVVGFLAQCGHESAGFRIMSENLNYSKDGLLKTFPKYFTESTATLYARQPEKIASKVYANRMGNGDEASKDGFMYRGRGAIQLTGKSNYQAFATVIGKSLPDTVAYCGTLVGGLEASCWFWKTNGLNSLADKRDVIAMTKKINGGVNGIVERQELYNKGLSVIIWE